MGKGVSLVLIAVLWIMTGVTVSAESETVRLGIEALESDEPYFDVTLEPGESADLTVRFSNHGEIGTPATAYAADVYTIPGGGMGMRQIQDPKTGPTEWLSFEADEFELEPGDLVEQTFTVTVPDDTASGDYITAIVIQNAEPAAVGDENQQFHQTIRQGVAVAIDVPGSRAPRLEIGAVDHGTLGGRSIVRFGLENSGNMHLRPQGEFTLVDDTGEIVTDVPVAMDTVYAGTATVLEIPLESRLEPGTYEVSVRLADADAGVEVGAEGVPFEVSEAERNPVSGQDSEAEPGVAGSVDRTNSGQGRSVAQTWMYATLAVMAALAATLLIVRQRRRLYGVSSPSPNVQPASSIAATLRRSPRRQSVRQLVPPNKPRQLAARPSTRRGEPLRISQAFRNL